MIRELVIGLLVFVVVALVFLQSANDINNAFDVTVNESYLADYGVKDTNDLVTDVSSKAPGGASSEQGTGGDIETDTDLGYKAGAVLFRSPQIAKSILFGKNETGNEGITNMYFIRSEFAKLLFAIFIFLVGLVLISSLLRNVIK